MALGLLAAALFGAATPASKWLLSAFGPFQLAGLLYAGAAFGVLPVVLRERPVTWPWRTDPVTRRRLLGAVCFGGMLGPVFLLLGLRLATSASVALWLNLELVATVLLGCIFFRDHLTSRSWLAAGITLVGAVLLSASEGTSGVRAGLLVFLACLCWGLDNHWTALIGGMSPSQTTLWKGAIAGTTNLTIGLFVEPLTGSFDVFALALVVGALSYGVSIVLYIVSAQQLGATRGQIVFSTAPFTGLLLSVVLLGEFVSWLQGVAALLMVMSIVLLVIEAHAHRHEHSRLVHRHRHRHDPKHHDHEHDEDMSEAGHSHQHEHPPMVHTHLHWPDLHHRHPHEEETQESAAD